jgi:hypothetical protein
MIEFVFTVLARSWVPWALSGLLVLGAVVLWLDFRRRLELVVGGLEEALAIIEDAASPAAFRDRFPSISEALARSAIIGEAWRSFAQTLVPVPDRDRVLGATRRPADHFNDGILAGAGLNLRFHMAVPNYLVGLGLLFTFLGLVAALYFASAGVTAASVQEAQGALRDLLGAATFKFVTSIAGLGASIVYSLREKDQLYRFGRLLGRLCASLEARLVVLTPEYLAIMQLDQLRSQTMVMRRIGRNLHVTVPDTIEDRLAEELLDAVQPMREGFARAAARLTTLDERLAERLAEPATTPVSGSIAGRGQVDLAPMLEELRRLRVAVEALPLVAVPPTVGTPPQDAEAIRALPSLVALLDASSEGLRTLDARLQQAVTRLRTALDVLPANPDDPAATGTARERLHASLDALADTHRQLEDLGRAFRDVACASHAVLEVPQNQAYGDDPVAAHALDELNRSVERFNERVRAFVGQAEEDLARSSRWLTNAASHLEHGPQ